MKLDYIKLLHQFWQLRRSKRITSKQADLFFFLVQECNAKYWENPFECSNKLIVASIDITEPSLIDARNRLKQLGLIEFQSGKRNETSPVYKLFYLNNLSRNRGDALVEPLVETELNDIPIKKPNQTKHKPNQTSNSHSGETPGKKKNDSDSTEHWKAIVECWFIFYKKNYQIEPSFDGAAAKSLKTIVTRIEKAATKAGNSWTEEYAVNCLRHFFQKSIGDQWLKENFLLSNLASKFDAIIQKSNGFNQQRQPTGSGVNVASAFDKIDRMSD